MLGKNILVDDSCVLALGNLKKSNSIWTDFSKHGNHGAVEGAVAGRVGYSFDGVDDYIKAPNIANQNTGTIALWFRPTNTFNSSCTVQELINVDGGGFGDGDFSLALGGYQNNTEANGKLMFTTQGEGNFNMLYSTNTSWSAGTWHNIVIAYNGMINKMYVDGILDNSKAGTANIFGTSLVYFGRYVSTSSALFNGSINGPRIDTRAWSAEEVNYNYGLTRKYYEV